MTTTFPDDVFIEHELEAMRGSMLFEIGRANRTRRRAHIATVTVAVLVAESALTAGSVAVVRASQAAIADSVVCHEQADTGSFTVTVGQASRILPDGSSQRLPAPDLLSLCQLAWRSGSLGQPRPLPDDWDPNTANFPVPRLALCESGNGVAAGFPNRDTRMSPAQLCENLGLAPWTAN